ncbi:heavy-metal-associated domain-containing protein [Aquimarina muelleri]|uniref:heavy-metal-associated domain-containing protein n=1 Tax=Aquimarina muelleri TaxID=279356 RepID=UPI003F68349A
MRHTYTISGMTCNGCRDSVEKKLSTIKGVTNVLVDLEKAEASLDMQPPVPVSQLQQALPDKYVISEKKNIFDTSVLDKKSITPQKTKVQELQPLFIIFGYITITSVLLNYKDWNINDAMLDFMGLFYIVFSFFKILDLKGFPGSFRMYDPLAKAIPLYGWIYPFLEIALGVLFLMRLQIVTALIATIIILGITTIGVTKTLVDKKSIQCACLGTALKLPMTQATFIENTIMIIMAITMLTQLF